ncbi:MAG: hypothetical protein WBG10_13250 [Pseudolabrys sp.]
MITSFAGISGARSADLQMPPLAPAMDYSGWYLRGDIGFSNQQVGSLFNENYSGLDSVTNIGRGFDAAPFFGLGVGYNVNDWLRFDVTGEYRSRANFHGLDTGFTSVGTWRNFTPFIGAGAGFSRLDLGKATAGTLVNYTFAGTETPLEFRHLTSLDAKLGVRYNFGAYDEPPPPPPLRSRG